ncbi:hypothetical protein H2198_006763 [Neophaeococcomyces mojaviensis]|uniref:Uncharacterized protein n=1 Tax=Neophaeococcomyces mojaviensis TaxID=3383035 RepID=A0ACC3A2C8_9EURO|nr:hypothetical protein H2198_006763 [Knufia sp. JES_112]
MNPTRVDYSRLKQELETQPTVQATEGLQQWKEPLSQQASAEYKALQKQEKFTENRTTFMRRIPKHETKTHWGMKYESTDVDMFVMRIGVLKTVKERLTTGEEVEFGELEEGKTFKIPKGKIILLPTDLDVIWSFC